MHFSFGLSPYFTAPAVAAALAGGVLLGCCAIFKTIVLGGVLGIQTYTKRLVIDVQLFRYAFVVGMVSAGAVMSAAWGGAEHFSHTSEVYARLAAGAFLVAFGASMQGGCTSGHGLTGMARLSRRSLIAVPLFMLAGIITATLANSSKAFPPQPSVEGDLPRWPLAVAVCGGGVVLLLVMFAVVVREDWHRAATPIMRSRQEKAAYGVSLVLELLIGAFFGTGLMVSGMGRPSKVAAFLDLGHGAWDLSLAFVMGGALCVTFPFFQALERCKIRKMPVLAKTFDLPGAAGKIDARLLGGAVCFGAGWGTCGICPGPIWVNVGAAPSGEIAVTVAALIVGTVAWEVLRHCLDAPSVEGARAPLAVPTGVSPT